MGLPVIFSEFRAPSEAVLEPQILVIPGRLTTILDAEDNVAGRVTVPENRLVDMPVYHNTCPRLGSSRILRDKKRTGPPIRDRATIVKNPRVRLCCAGDIFSSTAPVVKNESDL